MSTNCGTGGGGNRKVLDADFFAQHELEYHACRLDSDPLASTRDCDCKCGRVYHKGAIIMIAGGGRHGTPDCRCSKRGTEHETPDQPQGDVIGKMCDEYAKCAYRTNERDHRNGMTAAAKVCTDDRDAQWEKALTEAHAHYLTPEVKEVFDVVWLRGLIASARARILPAKPDAAVEAVKYALDPQKCPHRWSVKDDKTTMERVVYCELCGWEYSRTVAAVDKAGGRSGN